MNKAQLLDNYRYLIFELDWVSCDLLHIQSCSKVSLIDLEIAQRTLMLDLRLAIKGAQSILKSIPVEEKAK